MKFSGIEDKLRFPIASSGSHLLPHNLTLCSGNIKITYIN